MVGPVQQDVQDWRPHLTPRRQGTRRAVAEAAQPPGPVRESRDHVGVSLTHLWTGEQRSVRGRRRFCQIESYLVLLFCYLVDNFGFKGGNNAGIVKDRKLLIHLMKHQCSLENRKTVFNKNRRYINAYIYVWYHHFCLFLEHYFFLSLVLDWDSFSPPQPAHCYRLIACIQIFFEWSLVQFVQNLIRLILDVKEDG